MAIKPLGKPTAPPVVYGGILPRGRERHNSMVGKDQTHQFGKTIQLRDFSFLKVQPEDLVNRFQVTTFVNGEKVTRMQYLPLCLFSQASVLVSVNGNTEEGLCYTRNENNKVTTYVLQKLSYVNSEGVSFPFDACVKTMLVASRPDKDLDVYAECDIPDNYHVMHRNHRYYTLSPNAKQITLDVLGAVPLQKIVYSEKFSFKKLIEVNTEADDKGLTLSMYAFESPNIEILLDERRLFVTLQRTGTMTSDGAHLPPIVPYEFYYTSIDRTTHKIDESRFLATVVYGANGDPEIDAPVLTISLPYLTDEMPKSKTQLTALCNTGLGHHLYIRGEGLPGLSWNKGIKLQCRGTDAWIWETEAADLSKIKYKLLLDDKIWEEGQNRSLKDGKQEITPKFSK